MKESIAFFVIVFFALCACEPVTLEATSSSPHRGAERGEEITRSSTSPTAASTDGLPAAPKPVKPSGEQEQEMSSPPEADRLTLTILYDNNIYDARMRTAWGFSALVELPDGVYLFDTGADAETLLENMHTLEVDPARIQSIILSHVHRDHIGGLEGLLQRGIQPVVYLLSSFPADFKHRVSQHTSIVEVMQGQGLGEVVYTTGELGGSIREQALVVTTRHGLVIVTGCAHPGVVSIIERAITLYGEPVHLVVGGFHLKDSSDVELESILAAFRQFGVEKVAPCHCTGERAIQMFEREYGEDFIQAGAGRVIVVGP